MATSTAPTTTPPAPAEDAGIGGFFTHFAAGSFRAILRGSAGYYLWVTALLVVLGNGLWAYQQQLQYGLITTGMRDQ